MALQTGTAGKQFTGRTVLVTGGGRGIGAATAEAFAAAGADIAVGYRSDAAAARRTVEEVTAKYGVRGLAVELDVSDADQVGRVVPQVAGFFDGSIDVLVNNAGYADMSMPEFAAVERHTLARTIATNVEGPFLVTQAALRYIPRGGAVVNLGSCLGYRVPGAGLTSYATSKSAINGFTRGLARDLAGHGIRVNEVAPGSIDTDMNPADGPSADYQRSQNILGRYGRAAEVAAVIVFLAGPEASFVTGVSIAVDGGANT